jgi:hypothetical protein
VSAKEMKALTVKMEREKERERDCSVKADRS